MKSGRNESILLQSQAPSAVAAGATDGVQLDRASNAGNTGVAEIDAIVLAGDSGGSRNFAGINKNFLKIADRPLLAHVLAALHDVERITRIAVVGPAVDMARLMEEYGSEFEPVTQILLVDQQDTLYANFWAAFRRLLGDRYTPGAEQHDPELEATAVLVMAGDMPMATTAEIDEFLDGCAGLDADYRVGMTEQRFLARFESRPGKPGIDMRCLHLSTGSFRLNNLHFARPFKIGNRAYLERVYRIRYQNNVANVFASARDIARIQGGRQALGLYCRAQLALWFRSLQLRRLFDLARRGLTPERATSVAGRLLDATVAIVETTGGGCAIDVDSETDYRTLCTRYEEFARGQAGGVAPG